MKSPDRNQQRTYFETIDGQPIPAVTEDEMREVDRLAEQVFSLGVLQMMENAGRNLALHAMQLCQKEARILILAGPGGNGGGGLCCARHLHNHGYHVDILLSHRPENLSAPAKSQYTILKQSGLQPHPLNEVYTLLRGTCLIIDALLGYSLKGAPRGPIHDLILASNESSLPSLSLDLPSGADATNGETPGVAITPARTLTLALPKRGLVNISGRLFMADIGIPPELYEHIGLSIGPVFSDRYWLELRSATSD